MIQTAVHCCLEDLNLITPVILKLELCVCVGTKYAPKWTRTHTAANTTDAQQFCLY